MEKFAGVYIVQGAERRVLELGYLKCGRIEDGFGQHEVDEGRIDDAFDFKIVYILEKQAYCLWS